MKKITSVTATFLDSCNVPMASICGDIKFCLESYVKTVKNCLDDKMQPDCVKTAVKGGKIVLNRLHCIVLHDNDMLKNQAVSSSLDVTMLYNRICDLDYEKILVTYEKAFEKITKYEQLNFDHIEKMNKNLKALDKVYNKKDGERSGKKDN